MRNSLEERINWFEHSTGVNPWVLKEQRPGIPPGTCNLNSTDKEVRETLNKVQGEFFRACEHARKELKFFFGESAGKIMDYIIFGD